MAVTTTDARRILTTDLAPLIRRVQDVVRRRLTDAETEAARSTFSDEYNARFLEARERGEPPPERPSRDWCEDHDEPSGVWFWWDEPCWAELIHALRGYSLDGQAVVLEQHLRRVLPNPQAVVRPTILELHETERLVLRDILRLTEQWLAETVGDRGDEPADNFIERLLAGPNDVELTPREYALLEAHLKQPVSLAQMQREAQAGTKETATARNKLKLICDFNRNLHRATADSGAATGNFDSPPANVKPKRRGRPKADFETEKREAELAADWRRAHEAGVRKAEFAKDNKLKVKELDALLDRVAWRNRPSE